MSSPGCLPRLSSHRYRVSCEPGLVQMEGLAAFVPSPRPKVLTSALRTRAGWRPALDAQGVKTIASCAGSSNMVKSVARCRRAKVSAKVTARTKLAEPPPKIMTTHYHTLRIPKEASAERVKRSYRSLVKACHPDQFPSGSEAQAEAEERIREINAAYAVLSNPHKRANYDSKLNPQAAPTQPEPEHCDKCGKPTGYWHRDRNGALCHTCSGIAA